MPPAPQVNSGNQHLTRTGVKAAQQGICPPENGYGKRVMGAAHIGVPTHHRHAIGACAIMQAGENGGGDITLIAP